MPIFHDFVQKRWRHFFRFLTEFTKWLIDENEFSSNWVWSWKIYELENRARKKSFSSLSAKFKSHSREKLIFVNKFPEHFRTFLPYSSLFSVKIRNFKNKEKFEIKQKIQTKNRNILFESSEIFGSFRKFGSFREFLQFISFFH